MPQYHYPDCHQQDVPRETWAVSMFLDGNYTGPETYEEVRSLIAYTAQTARKEPGEVWTPDEAARYRVADSIKDYVDDHVVADGYDGLRDNLIGAALSEVNWEELAENKLSKISA
jgi:hypothetical protein